MRRSAFAIFAALLVAVPRPMYARGFGGFHGGGSHGGGFHGGGFHGGGFHGFHGGFHGFHGGFHGFNRFHGGFHGSHGMRFGHHHIGHIGHHAAALGFAAAGHRFAHMNHLAGHHGRIDNAFASRHAWNHWTGRWHRHNIWFGGAFWPYLYGDLLSFVFWPYDYYDPFWDYDYDWLLAGIFWPGFVLAPLPVYDIYGDGAYAHNRGRLIAGREQVSSEAVAQACTGLAPGVAELPIGRIEKAISPTGDQARLLEDLKEASLRASTALNASCRNELPLTPVGRLDAIEQRFEAVGQLLKIVQTPLNAFYDSLSEDQRRRFDAIVTSNKSREKTVLCEQRNAGISSLPEERIELAVRPTEQQRNLLDDLKVASSKAAQDLRSACPTDIPQTILERLGAIDARVGAMLKATKTVRPTLDAFYASLDDEQKARFNAIGRPLDQAQGSRRSEIGSPANLKSAEK
jgi:hypothetical protein